MCDQKFGKKKKKQMNSNSVLKSLIEEFLPYAKEKLGIKKPIEIILKTDKQNAKDPLGKTAYYDPQNGSITLYIVGRHPKVITRSLSHELVHDWQEQNGQFKNDRFGIGEDYFRRNKYLREIEREAFEKGNMLFRQWTDEKKNVRKN